jgi:hypothetical protein
MPENRNRPTMVRIFAALVLLLVTTTILFASGLLRHGVGTTATYVVYVLAGLVTAVLCFGLLGATGAFEGTAHGATLKLGGSIVAMLVVTGGGVVYEQYRKPEKFDCLVRFVDRATRQPQKLKGNIEILLGSEKHPGSFSDQSDVLMQGFFAGSKGKSAIVTLDVYPLRSALPDGTIVLDEQITVPVERDPNAATPKQPVHLVGRIIAPDKTGAANAQIWLCAESYTPPLVADDQGRVTADVPATCLSNPVSPETPLQATVKWNSRAYTGAILKTIGFELVLEPERHDAGRVNSIDKPCYVRNSDWQQVKCSAGFDAANTDQHKQLAAIYPGCTQFHICR